jgi:TolA-binding protein
MGVSNTAGRKLKTVAGETLVGLAVASASVTTFVVGAAAVTEDEAFAVGRKMFDRGLYKAAYRDFDDYLNQNPAGEWADEAQFYLGRSLHEMASYNEAIAEYRRVSPALVNKAECYAALGLYDKAIETYHRALAATKAPDDLVRTYLKLGETYFVVGDAAQAEETYEESLREFPNQETAGTVHFRLALLYFLDGDAGRSANHFAAARLRGDVDAAAVDAAYGQTLLAAGDAEAATAAFERSLTEAPEPTSRRNLSRATSYVAAGDAARGCQILEDMLAAGNRRQLEAATEAEALYVLALAQLQNGARHGARETFLELAASHPENRYAAAAKLWAGRLSLESGEVEAATALFAELAAGDGSTDQAEYWLGWCYFVSGRYAEGRETFEALATNTADAALAPFARYWGAEAATRAGNTAQARDALATFVAGYPEHTLADNALFRLGKLQLAAGQAEAGRNTFASLATQYPERDLADDATYLYAVSLLEEKNLADAAAVFWDLVEKFPASPYAPRGLYNLARAEFTGHEFAAAAETLTALLSHYPRASTADDALFMLGECYLNQRRYDRAKEKYAELVEKYPNSPRADEARYEIELCNFKQGKYKSQIELAKSYIAMYPQSALNGELLILLGEYYYHRRDYDQAQKYLAAVPDVKADEQTKNAARAKLAEVYLARGDTSKAVNEYVAVAAATQDNDVALSCLYKAADIYERAGDTSAAIETYGEIVNRFGKVRATAQAQFKIGENLRAAKLYKESNSALSNLVREWPANEYTAQAELYAGLNLLESGAAADAKGHFDAAAAAGVRALAAQAYYYLGICERDLGNDAASRKNFTKVLTNYRDFPEWFRKSKSELKR